MEVMIRTEHFEKLPGPSVRGVLSVPGWGGLGRNQPGDPERKVLVHMFLRDASPLPKISSGTSRGYLENTVLNVKVWRLQADSCIPGSAESTALLCAVY